MSTNTLAYDTRYTIVKDYVENHKNGFKQGTAEWLADKKRRIGGSEIAIIADLNPYMNIDSLIKSKIGLSEFKGSMATRWGNLFEDVIQAYIEYDKNTTILGTDIMIIHSNVQNYSPDGIGVMAVDFNISGNKKIVVSREQITLFEFKCPFTRIPKKNIPAYYKPQILSGLDIINCTEIGLFVEGVFRICDWTSLGDNNIFNTNFGQKIDGFFPIAVGALYLYKNPKFDPGHDESKIFIFLKLKEVFDKNDFIIGEVNDLGTCSKETFDFILYAIDIRAILVHYPDSFLSFMESSRPDSIKKNNGKMKGSMVDNIETNLYKFIEKCKSEKLDIYGILPWKLFSINYNFIDKEKGYIDQYQDKIYEVISIVNKCNAANSSSEKYNIYNNYTGNINDLFDDSDEDIPLEEYIEDDENVIKNENEDSNCP